MSDQRCLLVCNILRLRQKKKTETRGTHDLQLVYHIYSKTNLRIKKGLKHSVTVMLISWHNSQREFCNVYIQYKVFQDIKSAT